MLNVISVRACAICYSRTLHLRDRSYFCSNCQKYTRVKMINICPLHAVETKPQKRGSEPRGSAYSCIDPVRTLDYSSMYRDWVKVVLTKDDQARYLKELMQGVYARLSQKVLEDSYKTLYECKHGPRVAILIVVRHVLERSKVGLDIRTKKLADEVGITSQCFDRKSGMSDRPMRRLVDAAQIIVKGWSDHDLFKKTG